MVIFLTILAITLALIALGITLTSLTIALVSLQAQLPIVSISQMILQAYWITGLLLIIVGILTFFTFGIGRLFIKYKVVWGIPIGDIKVTFDLSLWKKIILLGIPPDLGRIKAEVRYRYENSRWTFPIDADWSDENEVWIPLYRPTEKTFTVFEMTPEGKPLQIGLHRIPLPDNFEVDIRLKTQEGKCVAQHTFSYQRTEA